MMNNLHYSSRCPCEVFETTGVLNYSPIYPKGYQIHNLSQTYMNLTPIFLNHNLPKPCLILSDWSLEIMLKALYTQERESIFTPYNLPIEDLLDLTRNGSNADFDSVNLIESVKYLANSPSTSWVQNMSAAHLQRLMRKVDELLCRLSPRVTNSLMERYTSIF